MRCLILLLFVPSLASAGTFIDIHGISNHSGDRSQYNEKKTMGWDYLLKEKIIN